MTDTGNGHDPGGDRYDFYAPFPEDDEPPFTSPGDPPKTWKFGEDIPHAAWWLTREIPPRDNLMGEWLATTSRILLAGPTGIGKTHFTLALAVALVSGMGFLHWQGGRPCRVLYVDGEMPRRLVQRWLREALRRQGLDPALARNLILLSREDYPDMPPLNTPEGQQFFDQFLEHIGPVEVTLFDNVQSLLTGNMRETEQWAAMLDWNRELTTRNIGQIWIHHTNAEGRFYGDSTRDWQMEATIILSKIEPEQQGIAFDLKFEKHRERTPENRADFDAVRISLDNNRWVSERTNAPKPPRTDKEGTRNLVLAAIDEALEKDPKHIFGHPKVAPDTACASVGLCLRYFIDRYPNDNAKTARNRFFEVVRTLPQIVYFKDGESSYVHRV